MLKTVWLKPFFGLSIKIWSRFSRLVFFNWVCNKVFTSFILEKNFWIHDRLNVFMHEKNISSEVAISKHTVYQNECKSKHIISMYFIIKCLRNTYYVCAQELYFKKTWDVKTAKYKVMYLFWKRYKNKHFI